MNRAMTVLLIFGAIHLVGCKLVKPTTDRAFTYLTYDDVETSEHIIINYLISGHSDQTLSLKHKNAYQENWQQMQVLPQKLEFFEKTLYRFKLTKLSPNSEYHFQVLAEDQEQYWFKSLPNDNAAVNIIQGGDMSASADLFNIAEHALNENSPDVILIGGDIAYANGDPDNLEDWEKWFSFMQNVYTTQHKRMIPMILSIGNHETNNFPSSPKLHAPFFTQFFQQNEKTYFARKLGGHSILYVLDSGHVYSHKKQVKWIKKTFEKNKSTKNQIALYHVPLYPSHRSYDGSGSVKGRHYWQPLFDKYNLDVALENHDHVMKRTYPIKNGQLHDKGVIYLGDGCWGRGTRESNNNWYLQKSIEKKHVWTGTLNQNEMNFQAYSGANIIDSIKIK